MEWYIPVLIFLARICDVSIGTVRTIIMVSGYRIPAALLGILEVTIWVLAVGGVITYLTKSPLAVVAYAGGFAVGILIGMAIEERIAIGYRVVRIVTTQPGLDLAARLRQSGFAVTRVEGTGRDGPVEIAFTLIRRRNLQRLREAVDSIAPGSFMTVERAESPVGGVLAESNLGRSKAWTRLFLVRK